MEVPRDGVERMISIRSAENDTYTDNQAGLISPQGQNVTAVLLVCLWQPLLRNSDVQITTRCQGWSIALWR